MDYNNIIQKGRLIYSSVPSDEKLRKWHLNSTQLDVSYYTRVDLSQVDRLVGGLLMKNGGKMSKRELGLTLGFDVATTEYKGQNYYTDVAEVEMYSRLLNQLTEWNIIAIEKDNMPELSEDPQSDEDNVKSNKETSKPSIEETVRLTKVGKIALEQGQKFAFYRADMNLYCNLLSSNDKAFDNTFPYKRELDITANISNCSTETIDADVIELETVSEWKDRLLLQLDENWPGTIYRIVPLDKTLPMQSSFVDFKLYNYNDEYKLIAYKNGIVCPNVTTIINTINNSRPLNYRIKKCLYYKLVNNKDSKFNYDELITFWDSIEEDEYKLLVNDKRLDWSDKNLFDLLVKSEYCTTSIWNIISTICPTDVIKKHLDSHIDDFNWHTLSQRIEINDILAMPSYPWDYISILGRDDITKDYAQKIFLLPFTKDTEWDWELVEKFLTIEFVKENINSLNISFYLLTSWLNSDSLSIILDHPEKEWDWDSATKRFSLQQIANNLLVLDQHINLYYLLDICFGNEENSEFVLSSDEIQHYLKKVINDGRVNNFNLKNKPDYIWNDKTIKLYEHIGLLNWESKQYEEGFAKYPFVDWTADFFDKYHKRLTTQEDISYVSLSIKDLSLISRFSDFSWDWSALSTNPSFSGNEEFISHYAQQIDINSWIEYARPDLIEKYFYALNLKKMFSYPEETIILSSKVSKDFIKKHPDYNWESSAFTLAMRSSEIDLSVIDTYYSRWNWDLLSSFIPESIILQKLSYPWSKEAFSKSVCTSDDAIYLINSYLSKLDWTIVSSNILYTDFVQLSETYKDNFIWNTINLRFASQYTNDLLSNVSIQEHIDWDIVTECIDLESLKKLIQTLPDKINWVKATKRLCPTISLDVLLLEGIKDKWDWNYLSANIDCKILIDSLQHSQLFWDWHIVTQRMLPNFIIQNLHSYEEKWDWTIIWNEKLNYQFAISNIPQIANSLNQLNEDLSRIQWREFTKIFIGHNILSLVEQYIPSSGYHWDYDCVYAKVRDITNFVSQPHSFIDWIALSRSSAANDFFHFDTDIFDIRIWKAIAKKRLEDPTYHWDFISLTRLENIQKQHQIFFKLNTNAWDWDYISSSGYCLNTQNNGEANLRKYKDKINFALLSKREDLILSEDLLSGFIDESWNWSDLSANKSINVKIEFILEHKDKEWDWSKISRNTSIKWDSKLPHSILVNIFKQDAILEAFDWAYFVARTDISFNDSMVKVIHKHIHDYWDILTSNRRFVPSLKNLTIAKVDGVDLSTLNWDCISKSLFLIPIRKDKDGHSTADYTFIKEYAEYLDWTSVTQNSMFDIYNVTIVSDLKDYLDWHYISSELENKDLNIDYLCSFKDYLVWEIINKKIDCSIVTEKSLPELKDYLDWKKVSSMNLSFSKTLLADYANYWKWDVLLHNNALYATCSEEELASFKNKLNTERFFEHFDNSVVKVYHFTHMFNALEVLRTRKILSRNRAKELGLLKYDSAGHVVGRTTKAHPYARFYYRPNTPTQFYNECLGWDCDMRTSWGASYYGKALTQHGLPKCPIPIFLEFDLREILNKISFKCYYSNGNLQTNWANVYKVDTHPDNMSIEYLYNNMGDAFEMTKRQGWNRAVFDSIQNSIREQSQQEFLVENEFDFSDIKSLRIHCYDKESASLLKMYLGDDPIADHIVVGDCFSYKNRDLSFSFEEEKVSISSNYNGQGDAYFLIKGAANIINKKDIKKQTSEGVIVYPNVILKKDSNKEYEVHFVDLRARTKDWLIYKSF